MAESKDTNRRFTVATKLLTLPPHPADDTFSIGGLVFLREDRIVVYNGYWNDHSLYLWALTMDNDEIRCESGPTHIREEGLGFKTGIARYSETEVFGVIERRGTVFRVIDVERKVPSKDIRLKVEYLPIGSFISVASDGCGHILAAHGTSYESPDYHVYVINQKGEVVQFIKNYYETDLQVSISDPGVFYIFGKRSYRRYEREGDEYKEAAYCYFLGGGYFYNQSVCSTGRGELIAVMREMNRRALYEVRFLQVLPETEDLEKEGVKLQRLMIPGFRHVDDKVGKGYKCPEGDGASEEEGFMCSKGYCCAAWDDRLVIASRNYMLLFKLS